MNRFVARHLRPPKTGRNARFSPRQLRLVSQQGLPILTTYQSSHTLLGPSARPRAAACVLAESQEEPRGNPLRRISDHPGASLFLLRHQFVIYRLFSLSGLIPVGAYLVVHLLTNASIVNGPMSFQEQVDRIHSLGKALPLVEWTFIFIPLLFHASVGWLIISGALPNTGSYPYASNLRYTAQRATGIIAFVFILFHVVQLHHLAGAPFKDIGGAEFEPEHASSSTAIALQSMWVKILYAIGLLSVVYHFANGLWTQGITWGLWTGAEAQRRASYVSVVVGIVLAVVGLTRVVGHVNGECRRSQGGRRRHDFAAGADPGDSRRAGRRARGARRDGRRAERRGRDEIAGQGSMATVSQAKRH